MSTARFIRPSGANSPRLNTFMDSVIALTWTRDAKVPVTIEGESRIVQAAEAYLVAIDLEADTAVPQGTTLVFPQVLQQLVRNSRGQYVLGRLVSEMREGGRTVTLLEDLTDAEMEHAITLVTSGYFLPPAGMDSVGSPEAPTPQDTESDKPLEF